MPKKTKVSTNTENGSSTAASTSGSVEKPTRRAPAKAKKAPAKKGVKPSKITAPKSPFPSEEEIRIRAYFISERRHRLALPGDATSDWEEARRQLLAEIGPR